jgi:Asp-tRNA(Asn)/Glu-tRNA(Gln) amidotransferase A subunit family amidase
VGHDQVVSDDAWQLMEAEVKRKFEAQLAEFRSQGRTIYDLQIDPDDTSTEAPELWCIVNVDTDELIRDHMTDEDVAAFLAQHPDWVHFWALHDDIQDQVHETFPQ